MKKNSGLIVMIKPEKSSGYIKLYKKCMYIYIYILYASIHIYQNGIVIMNLMINRGKIMDIVWYSNMNSLDISELNGGFVESIIWVNFQQIIFDARKVLGIMNTNGISWMNHE